MKIESLYKKKFLLLRRIIIAAFLFLPFYAAASESGKTVRVGWHEAPYCITDESGRRSGYTYEYQQKIAAYTGWKYEYVEGSWSELLRMLVNGDIDMMGNVSFSNDRAKNMLFSSLPMGTETYYLFTSPSGKTIKSEDYSTLNGKKVGVAKGSIQSMLFREWAEKRGIKPEIVELSSTETDSMLLLGKEIDAFVTMDVFANNKIALPVWKIASSDFFFAVSMKSSGLLNELNNALNRIQDENEFFSQRLYEKYLKNTEPDLYLSEREIDWLNEHGVIRVGYQDNYLAFCSSDTETGELTGALKVYLEYASDALENASLKFETISFPSISDAIQAMKRGEVDCVFPANMELYDSEMLGIVMTPALVRTEMDAVVRASDKKEFLQQKQVTIAVNQGNTNYDLFLQEYFPSWTPKYYPDTPTGLKAIADGEADCIIISNYRFNNISKLCEKLQLTTAYTGVNMDYCIAVPRGEIDLYSILARITTTIPDATVHTALTYYSTEDVKKDFLDFLQENFLIVLIVVLIIFIVIISLLLRGIQAEKKARAEEQKVKSLNKKVYVDALTSVRNKGAFHLYIQKLQEKLDSGESGPLAIAILDCDNLKTVNDNYGHEKGDEYLKNASSFICNIFQHSPVFRIGGDEFAVVLQNVDFENLDELLERFEKGMKESCAACENIWKQIRISMGIATYDRHIDNILNDTVRRADAIMYKNKRAKKMP